MSKNIYFVDQTLRDGQQSLWATRMTTAMMLPIARAMDEVGYQRSQLMGLGHVSACLYYLRENPFERMRLMARAMPNTPIGTGGGHKNIGQFDVAPDSVADLWMRVWAEAGAKYTVISDTLGNFADVSRLARVAKKDLGQKINVSLVYTISPVHTDEWYARKAAEVVAELDPDVIWIKDSQGLLTPERTRTLVPAILKNTGKVPLEFHSHCNNGLAPVCYLEAVRLGVRGVHTCVPPLANGTSIASALNVERNLGLLGYRPMVNRKALEAQSEHFWYVARREGKPIGEPVEHDVFHQTHGMAGGVISNLKWQLALRGMQDRWEELVAEIQSMCKEWGYPPNQTPFSQIMSVQAVLHLSMGKRYASAPDETIKYMLGHYGTPPGPVDQNVVDKVTSLPQAKRYLNWVQPQPSLEDLRKEFGRPGMSDEELCLRVLYPRQHIDAMLAAGPMRTTYPTGDKPVMAMVKEIARQKDAGYVHLARNGLSLTLRERKAGAPRS